MKTLALALFALVATPTASIVAPAPVTALAADGGRIALASGCGDVRIWRPPARTALRLASPRCVQTSTGSGVAGLAIAGGRALWVTYTGGNTREWSLWTASTTRQKARRLRFVARDVDAPPPVVVGKGDTGSLGDLLPYAVDSTVVALHSNGSRAFVWAAPARVTALGAAAGALAVATADGAITLLRGGEAVDLWTDATPATAVFATGGAVVAQRGRALEIRSGSRSTSLPLPAQTRLVDASASRAVVAGAGRVRLLDLLDGRTRLSLAGDRGALEGTRLTVARGRLLTSRPAA